MTLLAIIAVLLFEQVKPLPVARIDRWLDAWADFLDGRLNAGLWRHGAAAWLLGAALPALLVLLVFVFLGWFNWLAAFLFSVVFLFLTAGFRQFSHFYTDIHLALSVGDIERARRLLAEWRGLPTDLLSGEEVARLTIEAALTASHRHVFAPLFCFMVLGPAGAVLYRLTSHFCFRWGGRDTRDYGRFGEFAQRAFSVIDWLPLRLTAAAFAVVGDFEDALYCWRTQAARWPDLETGILLASGAGALGVRLGMPVRCSVDLGERPEMGTGEDAGPELMQSAVGLVWRTLVMALLLLALLGIAGWAGR